MDATAGSPNTVLRPAMQDFDQLVAPLTDAEEHVANALAQLTDGWTVYVQPRVGLDQPDFIAVHDRDGVCAVEVKGWIPNEVRRNEDGEFELLVDTDSWMRTSEQPRFEASRYRSTIFDQFFALPDDGGSPPPEVRAIVVLPYFTTEQAIELFSHDGIHDAEELVRVWGGDVLGAFDEVVRGPGGDAPRPASIARLRQHVVASERRDVPPELAAPSSAGVLEIATNPSGVHTRRVRGAAGSGKTYALAARAARLASESKRVLVLSFNVTLANRLQSLATDRCHELGANPTLITCANFHTFCTRVVQDAEVAGYQMAPPPGAPWTVAIVSKVEQAFEQGFRREYDAILVDEGQDFTLDWWMLLRSRVLGPQGEMLLMVDPTQDLYGRSAWTADDSIAGAGFSGGWTDLGGSYRLPDDLREFTNTLAAGHVDGTPITAQRAPDHDDVVIDRTGGSIRHWTNVERVNDLGRAVGLEVVRILRENPTLKPGDVTFLCEYHHDGVAAVRVIEDAGIPVHHIFSRDPDAPRRRRKHRFWPGIPEVKGCTIHSFKGWEAPAVVVGIGADTRAEQVAYVALTRSAARTSGKPAIVSVVNAHKGLAALQTDFESIAPQMPERLVREPARPLPVAPPATPVPFSAPTAFVPTAEEPLSPPAHASPDPVEVVPASEPRSPAGPSSVFAAPPPAIFDPAGPSVVPDPPAFAPPTPPGSGTASAPASSWSPPVPTSTN